MCKPPLNWPILMSINVKTHSGADYDIKENVPEVDIDNDIEDNDIKYIFT